ncbi:MAG: protein-L-isoaspartate(D-aspartate) O-methyltransferase [Candidatus Hydrothermarchaeales archaeon]
MFGLGKKDNRDYKDQRLFMVEKLKRWDYLKSERVAEAMNSVPRHLFLPEDQRRYAYEDRPLPVGKNQTISAPHMVAMMSDALDLKGDEKVLEIGAGTGYHACVVGHILKEGSVYSIEKIKTLAQRAKENIEGAGCTNVEVIIGDGTLGFKEEAPYDRIFVTAAAPAIPEPLLDQLKPGGLLLIPVGSRYAQDLISVKKSVNGKIKRKNLCGCIFVPLVGRYGWSV